MKDRDWGLMALHAPTRNTPKNLHRLPFLNFSYCLMNLDAHKFSSIINVDKPVLFTAAIGVLLICYIRVSNYA